MMRRKFWVVVGTCVVSIPLIVVATAYACGSLATLKLDRASARAGATVNAVGGNYNSSPQASPVQLRFNGRGGRVLWEGRPNASGRIKASFVFPRVRAGAYVILATQTGPDGRPAAGTPGRAPLRSRAASRPAAVVAAPFPRDGGPPAAEGSPLAAPVVAGIGIAAFGLLGAGAALVARSSRRRALSLARSVS